MAPKTTKRRSPHEGGAYSYITRAGLRWYWKAVISGPDGTAKPRVKRGYETKQAALAGLRDALAASSKGGYAEPSKMLTGAYLATWIEGLRLAPSTIASYRKNVRLHISPNIGSTPLASLTATRLDALYRQLEHDGRADHRSGEGLSARTTRYIYTIISSALRDAVESGLLPANPASRAHPPTARQAKAPEMHPWTAAQLAAFLGWSREHSDLHPAWHVLAMTGCRRGELLALRWRDVDLDAGTISVRRSVTVAKTWGEQEQITEGSTKTGKPRVIDIDPGTVTVLRTWRWDRELLATPLARDDALVFGNIEGVFRHPETFSKTFTKTVARCRRDLGDDALPAVRLHDLRHYADAWVMCPAVKFPLVEVVEPVLRSA
jgi:integrase